MGITVEGLHSTHEKKSMIIKGNANVFQIVYTLSLCNQNRKQIYKRINLKFKIKPNEKLSWQIGILQNVYNIMVPLFCWKIIIIIINNRAQVSLLLKYGQWKRWKTITFTRQQRTQYKIATNISVSLEMVGLFPHYYYHFIFKFHCSSCNARAFLLRTENYLIWS